MSSGIFTFNTLPATPVCPKPLANRDFNTNIVTIIAFKGDYNSFYLTNTPLSSDIFYVPNKTSLIDMIDDRIYYTDSTITYRGTYTTPLITTKLPDLSKLANMFFFSSITTDRIYFVPLKENTVNGIVLGLPILITINTFDPTAPGRYISPIGWKQYIASDASTGKYTTIDLDYVFDTFDYSAYSSGLTEKVKFYYDVRYFYTYVNSRTTTDSTSLRINPSYESGSTNQLWNADVNLDTRRILYGSKIFNAAIFFPGMGSYGQHRYQIGFLMTETDFPKFPIIQVATLGYNTSTVDNSLITSSRLPQCSGYVLYDKLQDLNNKLITNALPVSTVNIADKPKDLYLYAFNSKLASDTTLYSVASVIRLVYDSTLILPGIYGTPTVSVTWNSADITITNFNYGLTIGNSYVKTGDIITLYDSTGIPVVETVLKSDGLQNVIIPLKNLLSYQTYSGYYIKFTSVLSSTLKTEYPEVINIPLFKTLRALWVQQITPTNSDINKGALTITINTVSFTEKPILDPANLYLILDSVDYSFSNFPSATVYYQYGRVFNNYTFNFKYRYDDTNFVYADAIGTITIATPPEQIMGTVSLTFERTVPITLTITGFNYAKVDTNVTPNIYRQLPPKYGGRLEITNGTTLYGSYRLRDGNPYDPSDILILDLDNTLLGANTLVSDLYVRYSTDSKNYETLTLPVPPFTTPNVDDVIYGTITPSFTLDTNISIVISGFDYTAVDAKIYTSLPTKYKGTIQVTDGTNVYGTMLLNASIYSMRTSTIELQLDKTKFAYGSTNSALYLRYSIENNIATTNYRTKVIPFTLTMPTQLTNLSTATKVVPIIRTLIVYIFSDSVTYFSIPIQSSNIFTLVKAYLNGKLVSTSVITDTTSSKFRAILGNLLPDTEYEIRVEFSSGTVSSSEVNIGKFFTLPNLFTIDNLSPILTLDRNIPSIHNSVVYQLTFEGNKFNYVSYNTLFESFIVVPPRSVYGTLTLGGGLQNNYNFVPASGTFSASNLLGGKSYIFTAKFRPPTSVVEDIEEYTDPFIFPTLYVSADLSFLVDSVKLDTTGNIITVEVSNILLSNNPCPPGTQLALYDAYYKKYKLVDTDDTIGALTNIRSNNSATIRFSLPTPCEYIKPGPALYVGDFPTFLINTYPANTISTSVKNNGWLDPIYPPVSGRLTNTVIPAKVYPLYDFITKTWEFGSLTPTLRTNSSPTGYNFGTGTYVIGIPNYYPKPSNWSSLLENFYITTNQRVRVITEVVGPSGPAAPTPNIFTVSNFGSEPNIATIGATISLMYTDRTRVFNVGTPVTLSNGTVSATGTIYAVQQMQGNPHISVEFTAISGPSYPAQSGTRTVGGFRVEHWSGEDSATTDYYGNTVYPPPQVGDIINFSIQDPPIDVELIDYQVTTITKGSSTATVVLDSIDRRAQSTEFNATLTSISSGFSISSYDIFSMEVPLQSIPSGPRFVTEIGDRITLPFPPIIPSTATAGTATYTGTYYTICPVFESVKDEYNGVWMWGTIGPTGSSGPQLDLQGRLVTGTNIPPNVVDQTYPIGSRMFYVHKPYYKDVYFSRIDLFGAKIANIDVSDLNLGGDFKRVLKVLDRNGNDLVIPNYNNPDPNNQITNYMPEYQLYNFIESTYTVSYTGTYGLYYDGIYESPYAGTYDGTQTGTYNGSYTGTYDEIYTNPHSGSYTGTYAIPYPSPTPGTYKTVSYTGTYEINPGNIDPDTQIVTVKGNNNNRASLTVPFKFTLDGEYNVVIAYTV